MPFKEKIIQSTEDLLKDMIDFLDSNAEDTLRYHTGGGFISTFYLMKDGIIYVHHTLSDSITCPTYQLKPGETLSEFQTRYWAYDSEIDEFPCNLDWTLISLDTIGTLVNK